MPTGSGSDAEKLTITVNSGIGGTDGPPYVAFSGDIISGTVKSVGPHSGVDLITIQFPDGTTTSGIAAIWFSYQTTPADFGKSVEISASSGFAGSTSEEITVVDVQFGSFIIQSSRSQLDPDSEGAFTLGTDVTMVATAVVSPSSAFSNVEDGLVVFRIVQYLDAYTKIVYKGRNPPQLQHKNGVDSTKTNPYGDLTKSVSALGDGKAKVTGFDEPFRKFETAEYDAMLSTVQNGLFNSYLQFRRYNNSSDWRTVGYVQWHLVNSLKNSVCTGGVEAATGIPSPEIPQAPNNPQIPP